MWFTVTGEMYFSFALDLRVYVIYRTSGVGKPKYIVAVWCLRYKSNSTAGAVQVEANLQEQLNVLLAILFAANIAFVTLELALVTLKWTFAAIGKLVWLGSYSEYSSTRTRHTCIGVRH